MLGRAFSNEWCLMLNKFKTSENFNIRSFAIHLNKKGYSNDNFGVDEPVSVMGDSFILAIKLDENQKIATRLDADSDFINVEFYRFKGDSYLGHEKTSNVRNKSELIENFKKEMGGYIDDQTD